ncbi:unnamed protein product [Ostreobium quekettii]|uniref:Uncharacterized protein n=1 Tax=Ostreobium quekettii TaxID=121088 RepID=A0A8S1JGM4_9CHLO|nr:unnamed protein product [Ostreobium quekettii]
MFDDADGANGSTLPDWCLGWWDVHVVAAFQERRRRQNFCDKIERGIQNGQQVELCCTGASGLAVSSYYQVNAEAKFRPASKDENCIVSLSYASESADAEDLVAVSFGVSEVAKSASTKVFMQGPVALTSR